MIAFHCQCGSGIEAPDEYAGKRAKCPKCGQVVAVPSKHVAHIGAASGGYSPAAQSSRGVEVQDEPTGWSAETKIVIGGIAGGAVIGIAFLVWFFAIRDAWESDHLTQIRALQEQATALRATDDLPGASAKLHEILALVGNRRLRDDSLRLTLDEVRTSSQDVDRLLVLRELPKRLQGAQDLLAAGRVEESRAAFQAILDAVSSQGTNPAGALPAAERAREGLRQVNVRQSAIAAEKNRKEAERAAEEQAKVQEAARAKQREEEATRNAKIRATISGGAWSVKGGGTSDLLRGMKVHLLRPECSGAPIRQYFQDAADGARRSAAFWRNAARENRNKLTSSVSIRTLPTAMTPTPGCSTNTQLQ